MMNVGFLGLGAMGTPMALNLCRRFPTTVWNRTASKCAALVQAGAGLGQTPAKVAEKSDVIFTMMFDGPALRSVIDDDFKKALRGKTLINTSSVSVEFSQSMAKEIHEAGGEFIEMPVSGSKVPAETGSLVGMMAGDQTACERIRPFVEPITSAAVYCGPIGAGLKTKYAVNTFLITVTAGLAESMNLARAQGLDLEVFSTVLDAGPLASAYSKLKLAKMAKADWSSQAAVKDCYNITELIQAAASAAEAKTPLIHVCNSLYRQAMQSGLEDEDMSAVYRVLSEQ
ncbi:putative NAD binding NADP oxidoreductase coenzyme F420-dependent [Trichoderma gracile]